MEYQFQIQCDQGAFRSNNEDAILYGVKNLNKSDSVLKKFAWMVIADGMGGHNAGEVASEILTEHVQSAISSLESIKNIDWSHWLIEQIKIANSKIFEQSLDNPDQHGMGTTGVIAILVGEETFIGWVGDSRCYWLGDACLDRSLDKGLEQDVEQNLEQNSEQATQETLEPCLEQTLKQLTKDHTMVQLFVDKGVMTQEEADNANNKNMLSRAIGIKESIEVDTVQHSLHKGDVIFLSTDGLHDSLTNAQLIDYLTKASKGDPIETQMLKEALTAGSRDNISFGAIALI